jgi:hypothetical protein
MAVEISTERWLRKLHQAEFSVLDLAICLPPAPETADDEWTAIVTHKGPFADGGHYIGFVKKSALHPKASEAAGSDQRTIDDDDNDWYKFDDETVSIFPQEKLASLEGGGSYSVFCSSILIDVLQLWNVLISRPGCGSICVIIQDETPRITQKGSLETARKSRRGRAM